MYIHIQRESSTEEKIQKLKKQRHAIILAHNYQPPEIQDIADFVGDSLDLSKMAAKTDAEVVVFCGVYFMAEMAKILSPEKTVLLPDMNATCPLADTITEEDIKTLKAKHPDAVVVCYVNTSASIKAESDLCCTSANGIAVINAIPKEREIIFVPDYCLGNYIASETNRHLILWNGSCPFHQKILLNDVISLKERYPKAELIVHPECSAEVVQIADRVYGTNGMCRYIKESQSSQFIIGTETGIIHRLKKENPEKDFYPASNEAVCPTMKLITQEKLLFSLEEMVYQIEVPERISKMAKKAIDRMFEVS